jgi:DNA-binding NtrC family response regulator
MSTTQPIRVLIAEDEEHLGAILEHFLRGRGYAVTMCRDGKTALASLQAESYDVALIDIVMPEMDGLEVLRHLQTEPDPPEVIIITGNGTIDTAITAIKLGAYDYISKPYRMAEIDVMVRRAWEKRELMRSNVFLRTRLVSKMPTTVRVENARMHAAVQHLTTLAPLSDIIVLHGPAGVGKTHLARYIHTVSGRPADAYVEVSSRDETNGGVAVRLFGHEPGTRRGETARRAGILQLVASGTVVIDANVLDKQTRAMVAEALAQRAFTRLGGTQRISLTARVIVCDRATEPGIDGLDWPAMHVQVPALRERPEDLGILASELVRDIGDGVVRTIAPDVMPVLLQYGWPGNVRELQSVITRAAILASRPEVTSADVRMVLAGTVGAEGEGAQLADLERFHIEAMLARVNWHQGRAAEALGISTKTLYRKMREFGFVRPRKRKLSRVRPKRPDDTQST